MNAGAEKEDVKEKRKTFTWTDEAKLFALRQIVQAGAHLPKNSGQKRLTAAARCNQDHLFQGNEVSGKNLGDQFQKWVTVWKAKWLDPRHNKSGLDGDKKQSMSIFESEMEDVVRASDEAEDEVISTAKDSLDKEKDRLAASVLGLKKRKSHGSPNENGSSCSSVSNVSETKAKVAVMQNGEDEFFSRMATENEERLKIQKLQSESEIERKNDEQKFQQSLEDRKLSELVRQNERAHEIAREQVKVAQEQARFQSQMMVVMQAAMDCDRDINNRDNSRS